MTLLPSAGDWPAVNQLLDEALDLPPTQRRAWLAALPDSHAALRGTLASLLSMQAGLETGTFMGTLPKIDAHRLAKLQDGPLAGAEAGELVGPWRLLRELGEGGMGSVWLAERADGAYQRQVALKLPRLSWARGLAERLARERDILATLEHPRIARLYDAGVDLQGRPWLALEHVQGLPLDTHAREARLDTPSRVRLLLQVCEAVAHAHSRLVIHRDLKPANILVDQAGQVKLLDFGIAKLVQGEVAAATALTELQGRALTLDYASPEQVRGEPLTTASDIYSLGVVAFELLAGARPYKLRRGSAAELEEAIEVAEIPPASRAAVDPDTRAALRGDLDAVLHKALQKAPIARYTNVDALAEDLQAVLEGRAVRARPDTALQRAGRWLRRHRWAAAGATAVVAAFALAVGVGATTLVIVALAAGLAAAWWQAVQARRGRLEAEAATARANAAAEAAIREAARAGAIGDFMVRVFSHNSDKQVDPESARQRSAAELLTRGVQEIDSLQAAHPQAHAQLLLTFGDLHLELQLHDAARDLFERSLASARSAFGEEHLETQRARTRLAGFLIGTPRGAEGRALVEQAHAVLQRTAPRSAAMAETLSELCSQYLQRDPERAIAFGHDAVALMDQLSPGGAGYREALARQRLGRAYRYADDVESAGRWLGEASERLVALYGVDSVHATESHRDLVQTYMLAGRYDEALVLWQQLLARFEARPRASVDSRLESMRGLASSHLMLGEPAQALAVLDRALALLDAGLAPRLGEGQRWQTQAHRAGVLLAQGRIDEALAIILPLRASLPPDLLVVRAAVLRFVMEAWHWTGAHEAMATLEGELSSQLQARRGSGFQRQDLLGLAAPARLRGATRRWRAHVWRRPMRHSRRVRPCGERASCRRSRMHASKSPSAGAASRCRAWPTSGCRCWPARHAGCRGCCNVSWRCCWWPRCRRMRQRGRPSRHRCGTCARRRSSRRRCAPGLKRWRWPTRGCRPRLDVDPGRRRQFAPSPGPWAGMLCGRHGAHACP